MFTYNWEILFTKHNLSVGVADNDGGHRLDDGAIYDVAKGEIQDENIVG